MEKVNFSYSMKNIPLSTKDSYRKNLIFNLESFIKRITLKAFFFDKNSESNEQLNDNLGFKSVKTPPKNEHLNAFENDLKRIKQDPKF